MYNETVALCNEVIQLIDTKLFKEDSTAEGLDTRVFFLKMKGDYYRYAAEVGDTSAIENGRAAYSAAQQAAEPLPPSNPNKLGLALNYSVFYYEVLKDQDSAC